MSDVSKGSAIVGDASIWFDLGWELQRAQRYQEALSAFEQALGIDPNYPFLRNCIASTHFFLKNYATALDLSESLVRESPRNIYAWITVSSSARECRQWDKALHAAQRAFEINPNDSAVLFAYSLVLTEFRRFKRARYLLDRALSVNPQDVGCRLALAQDQLLEGDYKNGWENYESRLGNRVWGIAEKVSPMIDAQIPRWRGESLAQKNIMIWHEPRQGFGDEILFVRYAAKLADRARVEGGLVMYCCWPQMYTLFARSLAEYFNELFVTSTAKGMVLQPEHFKGRGFCNVH